MPVFLVKKTTFLSLLLCITILGCSNESNEVIDLAKKARTFYRVDNQTKKCSRCKNTITGGHSNEFCIKNYLDKQDGIVDIKGWKVVNNIGNNFLVENHFTIDGESFQYAVEVNPELSRVKEIRSLKQKSYYYPEINKYLKKIHTNSSYSMSYNSFLTEFGDYIPQEDFEQLVDNSFKDEDMSFSTYRKKINIGNNHLEARDFFMSFDMEPLYQK